MNPAFTWRFNPEYLGAIHSTKISTGPTGKIRVHLKRWTRFFETFPVGPNRSTEFWTKISGNFGWVDRALGDWILKSDFPPPPERETRVAKIQGWRVPWKKNCSPFHLSCNWQWPLLLFKHWKIFINDSLTCSKFKQRNVFKKVSLLSLILN